MPAKTVTRPKTEVVALDDSDVVVIEFAPALPVRPAAEIAELQVLSLKSRTLEAASDRLTLTCGVRLIFGDVGTIDV
jgi:hypothetical protein